MTKAQLEADQFAVLKAEKELKLAESKLEVFSKYTQVRMQAELKAEIKKQEAQQEASVFTLQLSKQRPETIRRKSRRLPYRGSLSRPSGLCQRD